MTAKVNSTSISQNDFARLYAESEFFKTIGMSFDNFIKDMTALQVKALCTVEGTEVIKRISVQSMTYSPISLAPSVAAAVENLSSNYILYYQTTPTTKHMLGVLMRIKDRYIPAMCEEYMPYARHGDNILLDVLSCITKNEQRERIACSMIKTLIGPPPFPMPNMKREENQSHPHP